MRVRLLVASTAAVCVAAAAPVSSALAAPEGSSPQPAVTVIVNSKGLESALVKGRMMPKWLGDVAGSAATVQRGPIAPLLCVRSQDPVLGKKAAMVGESSAAFVMRRGSSSAFGQRIYQYANATQASAAWNDLEQKLPTCAGRQVHEITDRNGRVVGTSKVVNTLRPADEQYGIKGWVLEEDVQVSGRFPADGEQSLSADTITILRLRGAALVTVTLSKIVGNKPGWVFNEAERATIDALSHVATSRYSHVATKSL